MRGSLLHNLFSVMLSPSNMYDSVMKSVNEKDAVATVLESYSNAIH